MLTKILAAFFSLFGPVRVPMFLAGGAFFYGSDESVLVGFCWLAFATWQAYVIQRREEDLEAIREWEEFTSPSNYSSGAGTIRDVNVTFRETDHAD